MISLLFFALNLSITDILLADTKQLADALCNLRGKKWWYRVSDLLCNFNLATAKLEVIWKCLQSCGLPMSYWSVFRGMKVSTLLWFKELSPNRECWPIPP
jgi:hypothetical protein